MTKTQQAIEVIQVALKSGKTPQEAADAAEAASGLSISWEAPFEGYDVEMVGPRLAERARWIGFCRCVRAGFRQVFDVFLLPSGRGAAWLADEVLP